MFHFYSGPPCVQGVQPFLFWDSGQDLWPDKMVASDVVLKLLWEFQWWFFKNLEKNFYLDFHLFKRDTTSSTSLKSHRKSNQIFKKWLLVKKSSFNHLPPHLQGLNLGWILGKNLINVALWRIATPPKINQSPWSLCLVWIAF